jgi:RNA polymerase sigma-70 factor (ECF subfamily)
VRSRPDSPGRVDVSDPDTLLLSRLAGGDADAAATLYDRHARLVYALARRILRVDADAEDVVQEVFAQVWRTADRYQSGRASVIGWLLMLTRTRAIDRVRARQARPDLNPGSLPDALPSPDTPASDLLVASEQASQVRDALRSLTDPQRTALELAYYEGLTQAEIAARLSEPLGTVKTRMRTALSTLRERLRR